MWRVCAHAAVRTPRFALMHFVLRGFVLRAFMSREVDAALGCFAFDAPRQAADAAQTRGFSMSPHFSSLPTRFTATTKHRFRSLSSAWMVTYTVLCTAILACCVVVPSRAANPDEANKNVSPSSIQSIPAALRPWIPWVRADGEVNCVDVDTWRSDGNGIPCVYHSKLSLDLTSKGGTFQEDVVVLSESVASIPGDTDHWPQDVLVDGKAAVVIDESEKPVLLLGKGSHKITGKFFWDALPDALSVEPSTGIVQLKVNGKLTSATIDENSQVWLKDSASDDTSGGSAESDRLDITVVRLIQDGSPMIVETRLLLDIAGKNRDTLLPASLAGFVPLSIQSTLPARVENNQVRVQLRPGSHTVTLIARKETPTEGLQAPQVPAPWPSEEVWAFQARPEIRVVRIEGAPSIDPEQTRTPTEWKRFPVYRLQAGESLALKQERRGDENPVPDSLNLTRNYWLDFDGKGLTVTDAITGTLSRSDRLEMNEPTALGRVSEGGKDQFITSIKDESGKTSVGVELRKKAINISADSRINTVEAIPAVSWAHDFQSLRATLNLPPGWRVFHVTGVDDVTYTWIKSWSLLDLFVALLIAVSAFRVWGKVAGGLTLLTVLLTFPEKSEPHFIWFFVLLGAALASVNTERPRLASWIRRYRFVMACFFAILSVNFAVERIRIAMYPSLERPYTSLSDSNYAEPNINETLRGSFGGDFGGMGNNDAEAYNYATKAEAMPAAPPPPPDVAQLEQRMAQAAKDQPSSGENDVAGLANADGNAGNMVKEQKQRRVSKGDLYNDNEYIQGELSSALTRRSVSKKVSLSALDPSMAVQTGPGLPSWNWTYINLTWSGSVSQEQTFDLYLLSPWMQRLLALLETLLLLTIVGFVFGWPDNFKNNFLRSRRTDTNSSQQNERAVILTDAVDFTNHTPIQTGSSAMSALLLVLVGAFSFGYSQPVQAQDNGFPSQDMLDDLRERLNADAPDCTGNDCVSISRMSLETASNALRLRIEVHARADAPVLLPGGASWRPESVFLDGKNVPALARDKNGALSAHVTEGRHEIVLEGKLPTRDVVQIELPQKPHYAQVSGTGWNVSGIYEDGICDATIQLSRKTGAGAGAANDDGTGSDKDPANAGKDDTDASNTLPPFVVVQREIALGLRWEVETRISRLSPLGVPVVLELPLLPGESVATADIRVSNGKVQVNLGPADAELVWSSTLSEVPALELVAASNLPVSEVWTISSSSLWHVEAAGIPPVHSSDAAAEQDGKSYSPWPAEKLSLRIERPQGVGGQTLTIDRSILEWRPSLRSIDATLRLGMRASRGGEHIVELPEGAELTRITVNGAEQPTRQNGIAVKIPISPGQQNVELTFRMDREIGAFWQTPTVNVGVPSVNASVNINIPNGRWALLALGEGVGPAILLWSAVFFTLLCAFALSKVRLSAYSLTGDALPDIIPLSFSTWFLLGLGMAFVSLESSLFLVAWVFILSWRQARPVLSTPRAFNLRQIILVLSTFAALMAGIIVVSNGLLSQPDMRIEGNGSSAHDLRWFLDRSDETLPTANLLSAPMWIYRMLMLVWALWLALTTLKLARRFWYAFQLGGLWQQPPKKVFPMPPVASAASAASAASTTTPMPATPVVGTEEGQAPSSSASFPKLP